MPKAIDAASQRLGQAINDVRELLPQVRALLPEPDTAGMRAGTIGRHAPESDEPWNNAVADAYWNLWFGPGILVNYVRVSLNLKRFAHPPPGLDGLDALDKLAAGVPDDVRRYVIRKLEQWASLAWRLPALDQEESWDPVPAPPGGHPPPCPYCRTYGLRMQRRRGLVRCAMPGCKDADGMPTRARMERGRMTGEERLVFTDGTTMFWTDDEPQTDGVRQDETA